MKFGKLLRSYIEDSIPDWKENYLRYKQLKRAIKTLPPLAQDVVNEVDTEKREKCRETSTTLMKDQDFINDLNEELNKFNNFFIDKEEEFVIRVKCLEDNLSTILNEGTRDIVRVTELRTELVEFHGEVVLVLNWSMLNYTGLVKLLKKHDKIRGTCLKRRYLENACTHPFQCTKLLRSIVQRVEDMIQKLSNSKDGIQTCVQQLPTVYESIQRETADASDTDNEELNEVLKHTCAAIEAWQHIRPNSAVIENKDIKQDVPSTDRENMMKRKREYDLIEAPTA